MAEFEYNGITYVGKKIVFKGRELWVDGHCVADMKPDTEEVAVSGDGNITCDQTVSIYGTFTGSINAAKVIINGEMTGDIKAERVIINGEVIGDINGDIKDNRPKKPQEEPFSEKQLIDLVIQAVADCKKEEFAIWNYESVRGWLKKQIVLHTPILDQSLIGKEIEIDSKKIIPIVELCKMQLRRIYGNNFEEYFRVDEIPVDDGDSFGVIGTYISDRIGFTLQLKDGWKEFELTCGDQRSMMIDQLEMFDQLRKWGFEI
jgi:hypothetical protein